MNNGNCKMADDRQFHYCGFIESETTLSSSGHPDTSLLISAMHKVTQAVKSVGLSFG